MVKKIFIISILLSVIPAWGALQYLIRTTESTNTAFDVPETVTTWNAGGDESRTVNIGFSFPFNNTTYTQVILNSNGVLNFTTASTAYANTALPGPVAQSIYPYWDDLNYTGGGGADGTIRYGSMGTAGVDLRFVVTWTDVRHYSNSAKRYTFQAVLYEDGKIRFRYLDSSDADGTSATTGDAGATIGVQESTANYDQYSYDAAINEALDVVYYPKPILAITKSSCVIKDPVNNTTNPKRIPGSTIRYAVQVANTGIGAASNVLATDSLNANFENSTIKNMQIQSGLCNCTGVTGASNNGPSGSGNGTNPVILDFGSVAKGTPVSPTRECGYFEVDVK